MAIEPVFDQININCRKRLASSQAVVEARLLPAHGVSIARVLSLSAESSISATEVFTGEVRLSGRISFRVLFTDTEGEDRALDYNADFTDKIESDEITASTLPILESCVLDTDVVSVSAGEIKLASVAEIALYADITQERKLISSGGEGVYTHDGELTYSRKVCSGRQTVNISAEIGGVKAGRLLLAEHRAVITKRTAGMNTIAVEGLVISRICGASSDGLPVSYTAETPFTAEAEAEGVRPGDAVLARVTVGGTENLDTPESGEESGTIALDYDIAVDYCVYADERASYVADAFGLTHELAVTAENAVIVRNKPSLTVTDRVDGSVTLEVNMPPADTISAVTGLKLSFTSAAAGEDEALLEGLVSGSLIYYNAEKNIKSSVEVELPFALKVRAPGVAEGDELAVRGEVTAVRTRIRRGDEITVSADIAVEMDDFERYEAAVPVEIKEGAERELPSAAFSIHVARRGETLWDAAKAMGATPELLAAQNPDLGSPFSGGERITLFRHIER